MNNQSEHTNIWQGNLVRLRAFEASDWEIHYHWDQDSEMERQLYRKRPRKPRPFMAGMNGPTSKAAWVGWNC